MVRGSTASVSGRSAANCTNDLGRAFSSPPVWGALSPDEQIDGQLLKAPPVDRGQLGAPSRPLADAQGENEGLDKRLELRYHAAWLLSEVDAGRTHVGCAAGLQKEQTS